MRRAARRPTSARRCACAAGWPGAASTASTSPSSTCATTPGIVQCVIDHATDVRSEWVIAVTGTVRARPEGTVNPGIGTGEIEIGDCTVEVLNEAEPPPFSVDDRAEADEPVRLRYRYVDLRRPRMQRNLRLRARVNAAIRAAMDRQGFVEIETPLLWAPTPEGSREFSVPARLHHGSFYALPQSPQLAKQLLMVGGFDRYYQIARCLRDEDLRADRQFEFMPARHGVLLRHPGRRHGLRLRGRARCGRGGHRGATAADRAHDVGRRAGPLRHRQARPALRHGAGRPDRRSSRAPRSRPSPSPTVKALVVPEGAAYPRSRLDELTEQAKRAGAAGLAWFRVVDGDGDRARRPAGAAPLGAGSGARPGADRRRNPGTSSSPSPTSTRPRARCSARCATPSGRRRSARARTATSGSSTSPCSRASAPTATRSPPTTPSPCRTPRTCRSWPPTRCRCARRPTTSCSTGGSSDRGACVSIASDIQSQVFAALGIDAGRGRGPLRLPAGRVPLRRAAARRVRVRHRPPGRHPGGGGEHPRGHRVPQDPVGRRPAHRRADAAAARRPGRARHPRRRAAAGLAVGPSPAASPARHPTPPRARRGAPGS